MGLVELAKDLQPHLAQLRAELHRHPEPSGQEVHTAAFVAQELRKIGGFEIQENVGGHGVLATLSGAEGGKTVALRADMDALQITEETDLPCCSQNPGIMHACGHDMHTAALLGAAQLLAAHRMELRNTVRLIFQPAEEMSPVGGSRKMIEAGALEGVDAVFGLHVWPDLPAGSVGVKAGPLMAASDHFYVHLTGKSSHAAEPQSGIDSLVAGAQLITAAQTIVSRNTSPLDSAVLTFGVCKAGTRYNIVAEHCDIEGTCRTFDPAVRVMVPQRLQDILDGICKVSGCVGELHYERGYMPLINDEGMADYLAGQAEALFGPEKVLRVRQPSMCAEDFAFYLKERPGCFAWLGCAPEGGTASLHNSKFAPEETILWRGAALLADLAINF